MAQAKKSVSRSKAAKNNPQLKRDPAFMATLEKALRSEQSKSVAGASAGSGEKTARAGSTPAAKAELPSTASLAGSKRSPTKAAAAEKPRKAAQPDSYQPEPSAASIRKQQKALAAELEGLLPQLDCEGLAFLIEQARVHLYNMKVTELEDAARAAEAASRCAADTAIAAAGSRRGRAEAKSGKAGAKSGVAASSSLRIEATPGSAVYHIVWQDKWKLFGSDEIMALLKICRGAANAAEAGPRLYRWLHKERGDFFQEVPVSGPADPLLAALYTLLTTTFTIKR